MNGFKIFFGFRRASIENVRSDAATVASLESDGQPTAIRSCRPPRRLFIEAETIAPHLRVVTK